MGLRLGIVVETHHKDHSVDIVMADDGSRLVGVQVVTQNGSTRSGLVDMPEIRPTGNKWDITKPTGQDMKAVVSFVGMHPVVLGFLFPQVNQMLLNDPRSRRYRHQSDVETLIDGDGNIQITHPSGTYLRIGESPDADTLAGKYADTSATDRNVARSVSVRIGMAGGAAVLTIAPSGAVTLTTQATVSVEAQGAVTVKAPSVTLDTPTTTCTGNLAIAGSLALAGDGTAGGSMTIAGDATASGISLVSHVHGGVKAGSDTSGAPAG